MDGLSVNTAITAAKVLPNILRSFLNISLNFLLASLLGKVLSLFTIFGSFIKEAVNKASFMYIRTVHWTGDGTFCTSYKQYLLPATSNTYYQLQAVLLTSCKHTHPLLMFSLFSGGW